MICPYGEKHTERDGYLTPCCNIKDSGIGGYGFLLKINMPFYKNSRQ
jgi:hypothetical protein